ncbi:unnamed protein product, partial [Cyprideis torosa]
VHRFPILEFERLRYSIKSSTSGAPKIRRFQGTSWLWTGWSLSDSSYWEVPALQLLSIYDWDFADAVLENPRSSACYYCENFHRGRVSTEMIRSLLAKDSNDAIRLTGR